MKSHLAQPTNRSGPDTHTLPYTVHKVYLSSQRGLWPHLSSSHDLRYTRVRCCPGPRSVFWVFNYFEFSSFLREMRRARSRSDRRNNTTGKDLRRVFSSSAVNIFTSTRVHTVVMWISHLTSFAAGHSSHSYSSVSQ